MPEGTHPLPLDDDGITCNCLEGDHHVYGKGWKGLPQMEVDGQNWPLDFAAQLIGISEKDLRDLVRILGIQPTGTIKTAHFSRSGRNPRCYSASQLLRACQGIKDLAVTL